MFALIMRPFVCYAPGPAFQTWKVVQVLMVFAAAYLLWRTETGVLRSWSTAWLILLLALFPPIVDTIGYGQIESIFLLLLAIGLWSIRRGSWGLLGIVLAAATLIKLYPAYLLLFPVLRRRWQGL